MDNKKFEQLIDLIINENEEQARELFHEIVVEKSREIYESIMDEEMMGQDMEESSGMVGEVGDLMDELSAEEAGGMVETEDEDESPVGDEEIELDADDLGDDEVGGEVEDAVIRIEDKLDQLMAEFEQIMGGESDEEEMAGDEEVGDEEEFGDEEEVGEEMMEETEEEDTLEESITLKKVSVTHGDNGVQTKSPGLQNSGQAGMDSKPVKFSGAAESVPTSPKGPNNPYNKGETQVKHAGQFKNAPAQAGQDLEKAPAPTKSQASGVNTKSPVAEAKKIVKKRV